MELPDINFPLLIGSKKWRVWIRRDHSLRSCNWLLCVIGPGAGFYLNATQDKWKNWQMYDYIVKELPQLLSENFPQLDTARASIFGHSMGGHGALTIYLKNLDKYKVTFMWQLALPSRFIVLDDISWLLIFRLAMFGLFEYHVNNSNTWFKWFTWLTQRFLFLLPSYMRQWLCSYIFPLNEKKKKNNVSQWLYLSMLAVAIDFSCHIVHCPVWIGILTAFLMFYFNCMLFEFQFDLINFGVCYSSFWLFSFCSLSSQCRPFHRLWILLTALGVRRLSQTIWVQIKLIGR